MKQGVLLSTTEHLLAAIYSCGIDNIFIDIDSIEIPILDGSAEPFMQMLERSGVRKLRRKRRFLKVLKPVEVIEGDRRIGIYPADEFRVRCYVDFPHPLVGQQQVEAVVGPETFRQLLSRARTFCFERDIVPLRSMGLIRGGSLENAIVLTNDGVMNGPLRYPDEFGRHKALDLIGDLALAGLPLLARVEAYKAGHSLHTALVSKLLADTSSWTIATASGDGGGANGELNLKSTSTRMRDSMAICRLACRTLRLLRRTRISKPQGLKPLIYRWLFGTAEAVPSLTRRDTFCRLKP